MKCLQALLGQQLATAARDIPLPALLGHGSAAGSSTATRRGILEALERREPNPTALKEIMAEFGAVIPPKYAVRSWHGSQEKETCAGHGGHDAASPLLPTVAPRPITAPVSVVGITFNDVKGWDAWRLRELIGQVSGESDMLPKLPKLPKQVLNVI